MESILVVGGAGYIGSHMVKALDTEGFQVIVLDNLSTGYKKLVTGGTFIQGSLGDELVLEQIFSDFKIKAVMHFAAFSLVGESVTNPIKYYRNNISETINLIDIMIKHSVRRFIFSSTAAVYGEPVKTPIGEEHPCRPTNPYGTSKLCVENLLQDCDKAYGLKSICLRYFNAAGAHISGTIGEMHNPESHLIPLVLKAAISGNPIKIFGTDYSTPDGTCIRDYVHVSDLASAHLLALRALMEGAESRIYNLGNSVGYSVRQVIDLAEKVTGKNVETFEEARRQGDPAILIANSARIKNELNWRPKYEHLEEIIDSAWTWHNRS
jgi:UDP-glucose 4-epimerase